MAKQRVAEETPSGISTLIDPALILADDNTRFGLKQARIDSLAQSITDQGGVIEPVEVEPLSAEASNGHKYRLTVGFYRLAAVKHLNAQGAGLMLPTIIHTNPSAVDRLKRQLAENMERENQSPMDQAIAIKKLMDAGVDKMEIRNIFSRPGGRKGAKVQAASNSFINMTLSFLQFPKKIQTMIHEGVLGVAAAYQLTKVAPEKWDAVVDRAKEEREKLLAKEDQEDEKLLAQEKRIASEREKITILGENAEKALTTLETAKASYDEKAKAVIEAQKTVVSPHKDSAAKKEAVATLKAAEANRKIAEADLAKAKDDAEKCVSAFERIQVAAMEKASKLKQAKSEAPAKQSKAVGPKDIQKAAVSEGATKNYVMLNASEMRNVVKFLCLPGTSKHSKEVQAIGQAFTRCFSGETTDKQLVKELEGIVS